MLREELTCGEDPGEDPTLAVLHRRALVLAVLLQDLHAAAPHGGTRSIGVDTRPVPLHHTSVIQGVDLHAQRGTLFASDIRRSGKVFAGRRHRSRSLDPKTVS